MTNPQWGGDEFSLFSLGTTLLRNRWRIARWSLAFGILAALSVIGKPRVYRAEASFIPQGTDAARSNLASIAGQFGISIPANTQGLTPEFYSTLVKSPVLLREVAKDTFTVAELNGRVVALPDLLEVEETSPTARLEETVRQLESIIGVSLNKATGIIEVTATTQWPSVSQGIAQRVLDGVNAFNLVTRQSQATAERKFLESRLALAAQDMREAEDRLARFLQANRQYSSSPELSFQHDRLAREVTMRQGVYTSLSQAYEEVRLREVRDTPVITVVEPPLIPTRPLPRGRVIRTILGLFVGAVIGVILAFVSAIVARRKREGDTEVNEFMGTLAELRSGALRRIPLIGVREPR